MSQTVGIIWRFRDEETVSFERMFAEEEIPICTSSLPREVPSSFLARVQDWSQKKAGVQDYILHVELPRMAEHEEHDADPRFQACLAKAREMQSEEPLVWFGETTYQVGRQARSDEAHVTEAD